MGLIFYAYYERESTRYNLDYFLRFGGIQKNHQYVIIVNGTSTVEFPTGENIRVIYRPNVGYDFGAYRAGIDAVGDETLKNHDFFVFMNASVIGPISHQPPDWDWVEHFRGRFLEQPVGLFGTTIVCLPPEDAGGFGPKVESFFWCTHYQGLQLLLQEGTILCDHPTKYSAIVNGEYGLSNCLFGKHGYNLGCMLSRYHGIDWRNTMNWNLNDNRHPSRHLSFYGKSIDPYEVIFHKWYWEGQHSVQKDIINRHVFDKNIK
jgi:hypothetical protein